MPLGSKTLTSNTVQKQLLVAVRSLHGTLREACKDLWYGMGICYKFFFLPSPHLVTAGTGEEQFHFHVGHSCKTSRNQFLLHGVPVA